MDSILTSIKKLLGIAEDYEAFDMDIIIHINSAFMILNQLGVGPDEPFTITDKNDLWTDFISDTKLETVKSYIYLKVKMMFDPPSSSFILNAMKDQISEFEWRLNVAAETPLLPDPDLSDIYVSEESANG